MQKQQKTAFSFQYALSFRDPEPTANGMDVDGDAKPPIGEPGVASLVPLVAGLNLKKRRLDREENSEYGQRARAKHYDFWHRINARIEGHIAQNLEQLENGEGADLVYLSSKAPDAAADGEGDGTVEGQGGSETE